MREKLFQQATVYPPTLIVHMPRDERIAGMVVAALEALKASGTPAAEIRVSPRPVTADWLATASEGSISGKMAAEIVKALRDGAMLDDAGMLLSDPRARKWRPLVQPLVGNMSLASDRSPLPELLNRAYARHEIVNEYTAACLTWLEGGGKLPIEQAVTQQQQPAAIGQRR